MAVKRCLPKSYFVNLFYLFFYRSMHLYISVSYFVCAVSLTHSLRLCKPHLARLKYNINRRLHWMPLKLESFSRETTCLHATVISTVSVRVAVTSLPAPLAIKRSAQNRQDVRLTGRSPIRAGHVRNRPIPINQCISSDNQSYTFIFKVINQCKRETDCVHNLSVVRNKLLFLFALFQVQL